MNLYSNNSFGRQIDHLVYAVPDLEKACQWFEKVLGLRPFPGGQHLSQGTKNGLLNLGQDCYLEILAIDHDNTKVSAQRWMGIDLIDTPKLTRWALKSTALKKDAAALKEYHPEMGVIQGGERKMPSGKCLKWELVMPLAQPKVEVVPFMTDWQYSELHPTDQLPTQAELVSMEFTHPEPSQLATILGLLDLDIDIRKGQEMGINAIIKGPKGQIEIS